MTTEFKRPIDSVHGALLTGSNGTPGGTVGEVAERTGFPPGTVLELIGRLRSEGVRVNAVEDGVSRNVARHLDPEALHVSTTRFEIAVDSSRE